jgi:hypothetical protein
MYPCPKAGPAAVVLSADEIATETGLPDQLSDRSKSSQ